ncbi:MAG TPA: EAL domain-containing protein, partial [Spirochaetia bacterium]|nr:EAL domain-containing protein [Spirochaetia bacterium]
MRRPGSGETVDLVYEASALCESGPKDAVAGRAAGRIALRVAERRVQGAGEEARGFSRFSEESPFPVLRIALDGTLVSANRGSWLLLAHWKIEVGSRVPGAWRPVIDDVVRDKETREIEVQIGIKILLLVFVPVTDKGYVNVFGLDVSGRKQAEKRLQLDSQVFESASEAVVITDVDRRVLDVNRAFTSITGYTREEILGENIAILSSGRQDEQFYQDMWEAVGERGSWQGEIWDRRKNGEVFPKWLSISAVRDEAGRISRYIGLFSDISVMKQTQEQLYEMAHYDSLTGLPNRRYFLDRLKESLDQARRGGESVALMFVDLDGFKLVNDNLGHRAGDQLLREVGVRIRQCIRESDIASRMGGDEFTVILSQIKSSDSALIVARKILTKLYEPVRIEEKELFISSSIGIALFPDDARDVEGLLQSADTALYKAKDLGKNGYQFFSPEMNRRAMERLTLQTQMRQGLAGHEFMVYYQPQVDADTGALVGLEALARWKSPQIGLVSPEQFIPLAEQTGLIHEIGELVLREACGQGRQWMDQGMPPVRISVNISAHQMRRPDFVELIQKAVQATGFPPSLLELELTESMLIEDSPQDLDKLSRIKAMGIRLSIDDFGTKYSSFAYLRRLPIDRLKIDRMFVQDLPVDARGAEIVSAIIAMSRSLNLEVVAEGVETAAQADLLKKKGCQT